MALKAVTAEQQSAPTEKKASGAFILNKSQAERLKPYVAKVMQNVPFPSIENISERDNARSLLAKNLKVVAINDTEAAFEFEGETSDELLTSIKDVCQEHLRMNVRRDIRIPENSDGHLSIRQDVLWFELAKKQLIAKFEQLGEQNTFDAAMGVISQHHYIETQ